MYDRRVWLDNQGIGLKSAYIRLDNQGVWLDDAEVKLLDATVCLK